MMLYKSSGRSYLLHNATRDDEEKLTWPVTSSIALVAAGWERCNMERVIWIDICWRDS